MAGELLLAVRVVLSLQWAISLQDNKYDVGGGEQFATLSELIEYYKKNPMVETSGTVVKLRHPFNATRITAASIDARVEILQREHGPGSCFGKGGFWEEFESLQQQECRHSFSRHEGQKLENRGKNRYKNILPCEFRQIMLQIVVVECLEAETTVKCAIEAATASMSRRVLLRLRLMHFQFNSLFVCRRSMSEF